MLISNKEKFYILLCAAMLALGNEALSAETQKSEPVALAEEGSLHFEIKRYQVEGNTLLKADEVEKVLQPFTGTEKDFGTTQEAIDALEQAYRKAGYSAVAVNLPEQKLNAGVVKLVVVEAKINAITVEGNKYFDEANILRSLPAIKKGVSPNGNEIASALHMANESPSKQTQVMLKAGEEDGEIDARVTVTDEKPLKLTYSLDNTGIKSTGKFRVGVGIQDANLFNRDHVFNLQYQTTAEKPNQVSVFGLGYHIPLYDWGDSLDFAGGYSDVNSGVLSNLFTVSGKGSVLGVHYNQMLEPTENYKHKLSYGLDYRAYKNAAIPLAGGASFVPDYTVHPLSLSYSGQWSEATSSTGFNVSGVQNFPGGQNTSDAAMNASRQGARAGYNLLRYGADYMSALSAAWELRLSLSGQYTRDALVSGEQFGAGGAASVRGFQERQVAMDNGYRASAELYTLDFGSVTGMAKANLRGLFFYDMARVWNNKLLPGETGAVSIGSIGAGLRFNLDKEFSMGIDLAHVVTAGGLGSGAYMIHFNMGGAF